MNLSTKNSGKLVPQCAALIILCISLLLPSMVMAQTQQVTGRVIGTDGVGLAGVSVQEKGTVSGGATDSSGNFTINVTSLQAILEVSSLGYEAQEISLNGRSTVTITLTGTSAQQLEQIVVIGYGTASKRDLTGSIVKISGSEVADKPNANAVASLQTKVAGLSVVNNGTPGGAPDIRIRGTGSIGAVQPLYVVDGIFNDNIDYLNPSDIESIEVLKDPSSLAIFGVKGAMGVIAITTKRAKAGQTVINFNTYYGIKKLVNKIKMADAEQFKTLFAEENANNGINIPFDYTGLTANTDWIDAVTRTGQTSNSNISVSGSSEKNRFYLGLNYLYDEGIIRHEKLEKMQFNFNDELKVSKALKVGLTINGSRQKNPYGAGWVLDAARKVVPMVSAEPQSFKIQNPYGTDSITTELYSGLNTALQTSGVINPLVVLENEWDKTISIEYRTVASLYAELSFFRDFSFRSSVYADISNVNSRVYTPLYAAYNPVNNTPYLYNNQTRLSENDNTYRKFQQDHILTYKKDFNEHDLTVTAGFTTYYFGNFNRNAVARQATGATSLPIPDDPRFWYISNGFSDPINTLATSGQSEYSTVSALGRILYNYKGKYFINASLRDDASSQIPTKNRHQQFWALGAAWDISAEDFMRNQQVFDFLKLKGSVGELGNQSASYLNGTPINYPFYPSLNTGIGAVFGTDIYNAATPAYIPNPDLKWETVFAYEVGVELNAFNNRLHFEANYFNKRTDDLMTYVSRASLGIPDQLINGGSIRNWGQEFAASWNQRFSSDLRLNVSGNITFLKNEVLSLSDALPTGVLQVVRENNGEAISETRPGQPIGSFKGYVVEGVYQSYADILKSPPAGALGAYRPGNLKFKDVNGDGRVDSEDRTFIGNPTPDFTYGASVALSFRQFNLDIDMGGVYGNEVYRVWGALESPFQRVNYSADKINRWHGEGTSNWDPLLSQADRFNYQGSTYSIEDGSYFRIRNIQLGYNFPQSVLSRAGIKNLRLYVNSQNPITWKNNSGYTAEFGGNATSFGYDAAGGAIPAVHTVGLNLTF